MKIIVIYPGTTTAAWSVADGLVSTLQAMKHEVCPVAKARPGSIPLNVEILNHADLVLVSGPEHIFPTLAQPQKPMSIFHAGLTPEQWAEVKPPRVFWYHESNAREDQNFGFEKLLPFADLHFFPAAQDADYFNQEHFAKGRSFWLPFGVDTDIFKPPICYDCRGSGKVQPPSVNLPEFALGKLGAECGGCLGTGFKKFAPTVQCGFIGLLYDTRRIFLSRLSRHLKAVNLHVGQCGVQDIEGVPWRENAQRLAANYSRIGVFLNFPHLSQLLVTKVYEVMACGTFLLTPVLEGPAEANLKQFVHTEHLCYYAPTNLGFLNETLGHMWQMERERETIAAAGCRLIREKHRLDQRLETILRLVGERQPQQEAAAAP